MKKFFFLALLCLLAINTKAQGQSTVENAGMIALNPFVSEDDQNGPVTIKALMNKLSQTASAAGLAGEGFDNRFVITAHIQELDVAETTTIPAKTAVKVNVGIYVGDGIDGTLFSSYTKELKGIGDTKDDAIAAAVRKLQVRDSQLQQSISLGKEQIVNYYNSISSNIIKTAEAAAAAGHYEEALCALFAIPMSCNDYQQAQTLIAKYGNISLEKSNQQIVSQARAAWAKSPNEGGATNAMQILEQLKTPSEKIISEAKSLQQEITTRLKAVSDREWKLQVLEAENAHKEQMAQIKSVRDQNIAAVNAAAAVARAYYSSRPRVVYHVHSWW